MIVHALRRWLFVCVLLRLLVHVCVVRAPVRYVWVHGIICTCSVCVCVRVFVCVTGVWSKVVSLRSAAGQWRQ